MTPAMGQPHPDSIAKPGQHRLDPLNGADKPTPPNTIVTQTLPSPAAQIGTHLAALITATVAGLPPEWGDQARVQVALEAARYVAGGPLANQLLPREGFVLPPAAGE